MYLKLQDEVRQQPDFLAFKNMRHVISEECATFLDTKLAWLPQDKCLRTRELVCCVSAASLFILLHYALFLGDSLGPPSPLAPVWFHQRDTLAIDQRAKSEVLIFQAFFLLSHRWAEVAFLS